MNTSGIRSLRTWLKSSVLAAPPVTFASAPSTLPTVAGTSSSRTSFSAAIDASSVPLPSLGKPICATVPSSL